MGMEYISGLMEGSSKAIMKTIESMERELLPGRMDENTRDFGVMDNKMGKEFSEQSKEKSMIWSMKTVR